MTISSETIRNDYTGNGSTTVFPYTFKTLAASDLKVVTRDPDTDIETELVLNTDYTVSGVGSASGGNVTFATAPAADVVVTIISDAPYTQTTDIRNQGQFYPSVHEDAFDKIMRRVQQLREKLTRSFQLPETVAASTVDTTVPVPEPNMVIGWNPDGDGLVNLSAEDIATVVASQNFVVDSFTGTGAQTMFALSQNGGSQNNLQVFLAGVHQKPGTDYTLDGSNVSFAVAPANGVAIVIRYGTIVEFGTPTDGSVTTSKLGDLAVTAAKLAADAVTTLKVLARAITFAKIQAISTSRLLGRTTASSGDIEELTAGSGLTLAGGSLDTSKASSAELVTGTDAVKAATAAALDAAGFARTIASGNINTSGDTTINIPAGAWKEVIVDVVGLIANTDYLPYWRVNNDSGANYDYVVDFSQSGTVSNTVSNGATGFPVGINSQLWQENDVTANPVDFSLEIAAPAGSARKNLVTPVFQVLDSADVRKKMNGSCRWLSTSPITSLVLTLRDTTGASPAGSSVNAAGGTYVVRGYK